MALENILAFKLACNGGAKTSSPLSCRRCPTKMTCPSVQSLLAVEAEYARKFKGTIIEKGMMEVARQKKEVADYILGRYDETKAQNQAQQEAIKA